MNNIKELSQLSSEQMEQILENCDDPGFRNEFFENLLIEIGNYAINSSELEYDAAGMNPEKDQLGIGFAGNSIFSILISVNEEKTGVNLRFHDDNSPYETLKFWMLIGEHIPCEVRVLPDFE